MKSSACRIDSCSKTPWTLSGRKAKNHSLGTNLYRRTRRWSISPSRRNECLHRTEGRKREQVFHLEIGTQTLTRKFGSSPDAVAFLVYMIRTAYIAELLIQKRKPYGMCTVLRWNKDKSLTWSGKRITVAVLAGNKGNLDVDPP